MPLWLTRVLKLMRVKFPHQLHRQVLRRWPNIAYELDCRWNWKMNYLLLLISLCNGLGWAGVLAAIRSPPIGGFSSRPEMARPGVYLPLISGGGPRFIQAANAVFPNHSVNHGHSRQAFGYLEVTWSFKSGFALVVKCRQAAITSREAARGGRPGADCGSVLQLVGVTSPGNNQPSGLLSSAWSRAPIMKTE